MKSLLLIIIVFICSLTLSAQEELEHEHILDAKDWGSEFFNFPIRFAREIPYQGYEEAVFPPGWSKEESPEFWSYVFAWKVNAQKPISIKDLKINLNRYFDGLLNSQNKQNGSTILVTSTSMVKDDSFSNESIHYKGSIYLYEGRYTQKMMTLYMRAQQHYCEKSQQSTIVFSFSPQLFEEAIWNSLNTVTTSNEGCGN